MPVNSTTPTQLKEVPTKLKEVNKVAKLCRTIVAMPDELALDSFNHNLIFVTYFAQDLVDPWFEGPHNILA